MSALPLDPYPFGADGGAPKLAGRRRHHGLGVGGVDPKEEGAMPAGEMPAGVMSASGEGGRRRRRHTARGGVDGGRRRKHSRRAGETASAAVAGRRRKHSRGGVEGGRRRSRRHTRKH